MDLFSLFLLSHENNEIKYPTKIYDFTVILKEPVIFTFYMWASKSLAGPVESILHWSGGPVGCKC